MDGNIRVAVVDDADVVRESFRDYLDSLDDVDVVATATNGREIVELAATTSIDVVVMDVRMPIMSGVEATRRLMALQTPPRVIILTTFNVDKYVELAISYGARGFLLKDCSPADLAQAVRDVARGGVALSDSAAQHVFTAIRPSAHGDPRIAGLSRRELDVLELIGAGLSNREIAEHLFVAETTVKSHVRALLTKLDSRDRVALVRIALHV